MDFNARMLAFIESVKEKAKGGLTVQEAVALVLEFVEFAVDAAKQLANPGPEKKAIVLDWVGKLFDTIAPLVPVPLWYRPLQIFVRPLNRYLVLQFASALIEFLLKD